MRTRTAPPTRAVSCVERRLDHEPAAVDDQDLVDGLRDLGQDVARDEHGAPAGRERAQEVAQPAHALGVEPVRRLVEHEQLRLAEQRRREPEPLAHAERVALDAPSRGAVELDEAAAPRRPASRAARRRGASVSRWLRPERPGWKSVASSTAPTRSAGCSSSRVGLAEHERPPARRRREPEQHPQRRRLAGPVRAEEAGDRARLERERELVDRGQLAEPLRQRLGTTTGATAHTLPGSPARPVPHDVRGERRHEPLGADGNCGFSRSRPASLPSHHL